jgi:hypothetical protein
MVFCGRSLRILWPQPETAEPRFHRPTCVGQRKHRARARAGGWGGGVHKEREFIWNFSHHRGSRALSGSGERGRERERLLGRVLHDGGNRYSLYIIFAQVVAWQPERHECLMKRKTKQRKSEQQTQL